MSAICSVKAQQFTISHGTTSLAISNFAYPRYPHLSASLHLLSKSAKAKQHQPIMIAYSVSWPQMEPSPLPLQISALNLDGLKLPVFHTCHTVNNMSSGHLNQRRQYNVRLSSNDNGYKTTFHITDLQFKSILCILHIQQQYHESLIYNIYLYLLVLKADLSVKMLRQLNQYGLLPLL